MSNLVGVTVVLSMLAAGEVSEPCPCDCDGDRAVRVHELATGINIALERMERDRCPAADRDDNATVEVAELVAGVDSALHGCTAASPSPTPEPRITQAELDAARSKWQSAGYDHYEYGYQVSCFCSGPHNVELEVFDGKVVEIRDPETGRSVGADFPELYYSVDQIFDMIQSEIDTADVLRVEFDPSTGYPVDYYVDPVRELYDEELGIRISRLHPVENTCTSSEECDDFAEICVTPGEFVGCGVCFEPEETCQSDDDCSGAGEICERIGLNPRSCACDPSVKVCQPGCFGNRCPIGSFCNAELRCSPRLCTGPQNCPAQFDCLFPPDQSTGSCLRATCSSDDDCAPSGFCIAERCYPRPGRCEVVPP